MTSTPTSCRLSCLHKSPCYPDLTNLFLTPDPYPFLPISHSNPAHCGLGVRACWLSSLTSCAHRAASPFLSQASAFSPKHGQQGGGLP